MRSFKSFLAISFLMSTLGCFEEPDFSDRPEIVFNDIIFRVSPDPTQVDTLKLSIDFKDGNGDLGFDASNDHDSSNPYNNATFYQKDGAGGISPVATFDLAGYSIIDTISSTTTHQKLISYRTRQEPGYGSLPPLEFIPSGCFLNHIVSNFLVPDTYADIIDGPGHILDTLYLNTTGQTFFLLTDTLQYQVNENHYNISIDFLVKQNDGTFKEFDWRKELCQPFDGRFPLLTQDGEARPLEGTINYNMTSSGFLALFSIKTLKLRINIKDRALNVSNTIETPEFTLDKIRR